MVLFEAQLPWLHYGKVYLANGVNRRQPNADDYSIAYIYIGKDGPPCDTHCITYTLPRLIRLVSFYSQRSPLDGEKIALKQ